MKNWEIEFDKLPLFEDQLNGLTIVRNQDIELIKFFIAKVESDAEQRGFERASKIALDAITYKPKL